MNKEEIEKWDKVKVTKTGDIGVINEISDKYYSVVIKSDEDDSDVIFCTIDELQPYLKKNEELEDIIKRLRDDQ